MNEINDVCVFVTVYYFSGLFLDANTLQKAQIQDAINDASHSLPLQALYVLAEKPDFAANTVALNKNAAEFMTTSVCCKIRDHNKFSSRPAFYF